MRDLSLSFLLALCSLAQAQHSASTPVAPAVLVTGLGNVHHPISTKNAEAQRFFDQGLAYVFAFNHDEAVRSFRRAAELDPQCAMAYWGIGLALGPNINSPIDPAREKAAYEATQKGIELAKNAPDQEKAYVQALAKRYSIDPKADLKKLAIEFKDAMKELAGRYPDDLDAATLYAESGMDLHPWQLWSLDGKPTEGTEEIIAVLESVLKQDPSHTGANHYYIHAVEASPRPEQALPSAGRLKTLAPAAGHLVHMPSHIYMRTGDYEQAARLNEQAAKVDEDYIKATAAKGLYPMMYYSHNLQFAAAAHAMQGRFADARAAADKLVAHVGPEVKDMPMLESFMPTPMFVLLRFRRWDEISKLPAPRDGLITTTALWHFARGMAAAATGKMDDAEREQRTLQAKAKSLPADAMFTPLHKTSDILAIADNMLGAQIALARRDTKSAVELLTAAAKAEDGLSYFEPAVWPLPVRESLGGVLLRAGDAAAAERVFRADLRRNLRNGRSLFGLLESLKGRGNEYGAQSVQGEFQQAWKNADTSLKIEDL
jgi:tetratricopeptide (TPR) repeat protein